MSRSPANTTMTTAGVTSEDCMSRMFRARCRPGIGVTPEQRPRDAQRLDATWETLRMPVPAGSRFDDPVLRERDAELAELAELDDAIDAGTGRLVIVHGAPGIGKTELLRAARRRAAARGVRVLSARGSELEESFAYGVVRQLLERQLA